MQFYNPSSCDAFIDGKYPRTFSLQIIDRFGRESNIVQKNLVVKTGKR